MTLDELSVKYGTDKGSLKHNYMPFYEQHLPKAPKKILEIGVLKGASMRMWREWFGEEVEIHGLDLFNDHTEEEVRSFLLESGCTNFVLHQGNQCDYVLLDKLRHENFDIIIDDGSHGSRDQMITFFGLFNGGQYYIEDTHCNHNDFYSQGLPKSLTAFETFIFLNGKRIGINEEVKVSYGENIILIQSI
jgi:hypothetical protein